VPAQARVARGGIAERVAGAGAGASLPKLGATVIATGVIAGGAAVGVPRDEHKRDGLGARTAEAASPDGSRDQSSAAESRGIVGDHPALRAVHARQDEPGET